MGRSFAAPCLSWLGCLGLFEQLGGTKFHLVDPALEEGGPHEIAEQRVRPAWARSKLRMELARDEPRVVGQLDDLDEATVRRKPAEDHARDRKSTRLNSSH